MSRTVADAKAKTDDDDDDEEETKYHDVMDWYCLHSRYRQEAQLMLTTGSTRLAVSRGQQTWYHFRSIATFR